MEGLVELHDNIMYYLVIILFGVGWILLSIIRSYINTKSPISHKYLNHGTCVPVQKYSKNKYDYLNSYVFYNGGVALLGSTLLKKYFFKIRCYSTSNLNNNLKRDPFIPAVIYEDAFAMKKEILKDNKDKAGIYMWSNKITGDIYVGQSVNLSKRFLRYFNLNFLNSRNELVIHRALIKYGYLNFSLTILEYCDVSELDKREQYYFDSLNPQYNTQKIAGGSSKGLILSEETKNKISKALKGVYIKDKAYWYNRTLSDATKKLMSSKRKGELNPLYGKSHSEETKDLIRQKALGRKHSEDTKLLMSTKRGNPVNIYEKYTSADGASEFRLIGSFVSARRAGKFLDISGSTIIRYMNSGTIFKDRYKFSSK